MVRQYIGARYVPKFYENSLGNTDWESGVSYEPLTIVTYNGNSYTSKKPVPAGIGAPPANGSYWVATGIFNAQLAQISPLYELALRCFDSVDAMVGSDIPENSFAFCRSYFNDVTGEPIFYYVDETSDSSAVPLMNGRFAHPLINKYSVCVSQFGAVGDGVTDDTAAIQRAINYAGDDSVVIIDKRRCRITASINIPYNKMTLRGGNHPEYNNAIYASQSDPVSPLVVFSGQACSVNGVLFEKEETERDAASGIGVRVKHPDPSSDPTWYCMDMYFRKCYFMGFQLAADVYGRNIIFEDDTHFSNCYQGVHFHSNNSGTDTEQRGWIVQNCRFHTMGHDEPYTGSMDTAPDVAVLTDLDANTSEVIIKNNLFDGGCRCLMYRGVSHGLLIEGNIVEVGNLVPFGRVKRRGLGLGRNIFPKVIGNRISTGSVGDYGVYTNLMLDLSSARIIFKDNYIRGSWYNLIKYGPGDTGSPTMSGNILQNNTLYTEKGNTDFLITDGASTTGVSYNVIGNVVELVGDAASANMFGSRASAANSNKAECNIVDSRITF